MAFRWRAGLHRIVQGGVAGNAGRPGVRFGFGFVCDAGWFALACAGIRVAVFAAQAVSVVRAFELASALCLRASSVAPVRGGTYFSLPPQRKVGKRKRLTPPARVFIHGPPTSPRFTRQCPGWCSLPTLRTNASPASNTRTRASSSEWYVPPRWQTVCRLPRRIEWRSYRVECMRYRSGVRRARHYDLHTVCHLGGGGISETACGNSG